MGDAFITRGATKASASDPAGRTVKSLLGYGVLAGPFYVLVVVVQALTRPGFDLVHDDASLLSNGSLGWMQIANFVITGSMVVAFATGVRRALRTGVAATWGPRLVALFGMGLIGAGLFVADPMNGFPAGTPAGHATSISVHGMLHIICGGVGFFGLVAACFVLARRLRSDGCRQLAVFSRATGAVFLAGFFAIASASSSSAVVVGFWIALLVVWAWMGTVAVHLYSQVPASAPANTVTNVAAAAEISA